LMLCMFSSYVFFFFQAEDGIRDRNVTGVQTCALPIFGLVTAFDIKADVLVSLALIASVAIGEDFAAGEVAFIMQLGGLLEELTEIGRASCRERVERAVCGGSAEANEKDVEEG